MDQVLKELYEILRDYSALDDWDAGYLRGIQMAINLIENH